MCSFRQSVDRPSTSSATPLSFEIRRKSSPSESTTSATDQTFCESLSKSYLLDVSVLIPAADQTSAHVDHTSFTELKKRSKRRNEVALGWSYTSEKKVERLERSLSVSTSSVSLQGDLTNSPDLVYNSRKRGGDSADRYFKATEMIAGVKDMRFQAIMPDVLHWLGVQKIDNMISMVSLFHCTTEGISLTMRSPT